MNYKPLIMKIYLINGPAIKQGSNCVWEGCVHTHTHACTLD